MTHSFLQGMAWLLVLLFWLKLPRIYAVEPPSTNTSTATTSPAAADSQSIRVSPRFLRVEVSSGGQVRIQVAVQLIEAGTLLGVDIACPCVTTDLALPYHLPTGETLVPLVVKGVLPGLKKVTFRTTQGTQTLIVDIVTPGFGDGIQVARTAAQAAAASKLSLVAIVHDLRGAVRNCGCSSGSLGGIEHLAALSQVLPGARLVLTGDVDGTTPGVASALAAHGWEVRPADIVVAADPLPLLAQPGVLAVLVTGATTVAHQRIVTPVLDRGTLAHLLLVDGGGRVVEQRLLPIDRSLPSISGLIERFARTGQIVLDRAAAPSTSCKACHTTAHTGWLVTAHARALNSLSASDQTSACATCHTTALPGRVERAPHVGCTACHQGAAAHAAQPSMKTTGTTRCGECHDAKHHPAFDEVSAWLRIQHGK